MEIMERFHWPRRLHEDRAPDVIVGIDVGMCFTKVAYTIRQDDSFGVIKAIQNWPKMGGEEDEANYVPTLLGYEKGHDIMQDAPQFVGFPRKEDKKNPDLKFYEWFKKDFPANLSSKDRDPPPFWPRISDDTETHVLYRTFLAELYASIESVLSPMLQRIGMDWNHAQIEFIFSVPATWNRPNETLGMVADSLMMVAKEARFEGEKRVVKIGMTEPEAAAAFALATHEDLVQGNVQSGKTILIVDAGGGTTDLCLLKMEQSQGKQFEMDPLSAPMGEDLGATHIDRGFEDLAVKKLTCLHDEAKIQKVWNFKEMARKMRDSPEFENFKGLLNLDKARSDQFFTVPLPQSCANDMPQHTQVYGVVNASMKFKWSELATIFDTVIQDRQVVRKGRPETLPGLNKLIQRARDELRYRGNNHGGSRSPNNDPDDVSVILMSGGLGRSEYITQRITEYLSYQEDTLGPVPEVRIIGEPQLCVCKGLLKNRLYTIFRTQRCNGNYGILEYKPYKKFYPTHFIANQANHVKKIGGSRYKEEVKWLIQKSRKTQEASGFPVMARHVHIQIPEGAKLGGHQVSRVSGHLLGNTTEITVTSKRESPDDGHFADQVWANFEFMTQWTFAVVY
ncbi:uncharacterized protein ColSpa_12415 [Colletotrichum spaethianum]|uniref:Hsp70-like protein n=1 Tax=Colletotrichum spaethianum TaxID=700344 RepID=A0AA37PHC3_9PEZI|nr:uncharacterized protein ColSpa_12415 [Colletotrichum spaethianum]GKT52234.1 hypothetical protein ColSpa_12415 [Colletotrichum spaethianum]